ncbi:MAG: hypothetical protein AB7K52_05615 [Phycisphaerales bacterium]
MLTTALTPAALPLSTTLGVVQASTVLFVLLVLAVVICGALSLFPAVRRANALFAPILVILTLAVTALALGGLLYAIHVYT